MFARTHARARGSPDKVRQRRKEEGRKEAAAGGPLLFQPWIMNAKTWLCRKRGVFCSLGPISLMDGKERKKEGKSGK